MVRAKASWLKKYLIATACHFVGIPFIHICRDDLIQRHALFICARVNGIDIA